MSSRRSRGNLLAAAPAGATCAAFALVAAIAASAGSLDHFLAEFASPTRWLLFVAACALNAAAVAAIRLWPGARGAGVLGAYAAIVLATLVAGWRWAQPQVPVAFWVADIVAMAMVLAVAMRRESKRKAVQADVQSSFLASRLSK